VRFQPHDYQRKGIALLCREPGGAGLLLDPGMGKTAIAASAYLQLKEALPTVRSDVPRLRMLVIAPIQPMYSTWPNELAKWDQFKGLTISIVHGSPDKRRAALAVSADIYIINPEGLKWLFDKAQLPLHPEWRVLCVDESTKFKKSDTKRFKLIKHHLQQFWWRWIMTGTIAPNGLGDLFGQVYMMDQGKALGKYVTHYRNAYFTQVGFGGYTWAPRLGATEAVTAKIEGKVLQLKAEDYLDMPDMMKIEIEVELPPSAMETYKEVEDDFISEVGNSTILANSAGAQGIKLRQVANGAVYGAEGEVVQVHDAKIEALETIVEETNGHPLLIMYEFKHDRARIQALLGDACVCVTGLAANKLITVVEMFNAGQIKYLLMHPGSAHGMNIQKSCHHIVWFSIIWDLEFYIQSTTRLYRQGQSNPSVMCYHIVAAGTIDRVISKALRRKELTQKAIEENLRRYCGVQENA
jgi:SNF2 family DNA or RNA helicase